MKVINPLLYRPPILPEETLPSYLYRLAEANLLSPGQLDALIKSYLGKHDNVKRLLRGDSIDLLAKLTNLEAYKIFWASEHSLVSLLEDLDEMSETVTLDSGFSFPLLTENATSTHLRPISRAQFCPYCLKETIYQRRAWRLKKVAACIQHECLLIDRCPNCKSYLSENDIFTATCRKCLNPLAAAVALDLSSDQNGLDTQRLLYFWLNAGGHICLPLPPIFSRDLYLLASQMTETILKIRHGLEGLHPFPSLNTPYNWKNRAPSPRHTYIVWATAIRAMYEWPINFHQFLENRTNADISGYSAGTLIRKCWWLSGWLLQWPLEKNPVIHEAISVYLHDNFCWGYTQTKSNIRNALRAADMTSSFPAFSGKFMWVRESIALRLLKIRPELVKQLTQAGLIRENPKTSKLKDPLLSREDILEIYHRWEEGIPLSDVGLVLHISRELAHKLLDARILMAAERKSGADQDGYLDKSSVNYLISRLNYKPRLRNVAKSAFYNLEEACEILAPSGYDDLVLIQLALDKTIPALLWSGNTLGDILFQRKAIRKLAENKSKLTY